MKCVQMSWMVIFVGLVFVGKISLVQFLVYFIGYSLKIMVMNSVMDITEFLGGFEQVIDLSLCFQVEYNKFRNLIDNFVCWGQLQVAVFFDFG